MWLRDNYTTINNGLGLISNFGCVMNVSFFLLGDSPASEFYMLMFRNTLFHLLMWCKQEESFLLTPHMKKEHVPKRKHIKFRRQGITQKKEYNGIELGRMLYTTICMHIDKHTHTHTHTDIHIYIYICQLLSTSYML